MDRRDDYTAFVNARWHSLVRSAVFLGASAHEAEDVVQTTLERCYRSWDSVARARDPDAYVYRMLVNCFTRSRRRRWSGERPAAELPEPASLADEAGDADLSLTVVAALARLTPEHRAVLVLRFFADLTEQQTADVLEIPAGTVKSRTARALANTAADPTLVALFKHEES